MILDPKKREWGTKSLTDTYKKDTPGQRKIKTFLEFTGYYPPVSKSWSPSPHFAPGDKPKPIAKSLPRTARAMVTPASGKTVPRMVPTFSYKQEKGLARPKNRFSTFTR